jgi:DNA-binding NarL/FixJ family response regulator
MQDRIRRVIEAAPGLRLAYAADNAASILEWLSNHAVDVLLVDLGLPPPGPDGFGVIRACRQLQPNCAVMVITIFGDDANMLKAFEAGASGYLLKDGTEDDLVVHVHNLHAGGSPMSPRIASQLLARWREGTTATSIGAGANVSGIVHENADKSAALRRATTLSGREMQVLDLIARGFTYPEIARQLGLSVTTVQTHVRGVYGKLDVHTKTEAVYEARYQGLLP